VLWIFTPPTFIIFWEALSKNPVIFADLLDSCHSFIRAIVIKSAPRDHEWQRELHEFGCHKIRAFSLNIPIVPFWEPGFWETT
jgi:hypothetical protein